MAARKYLSDPTEDVRVATENLLADFLRELRDVTFVSRQLDQHIRTKNPAENIRRPKLDGGRLPDLTLENAERALYMFENDDQDHPFYNNQTGGAESAPDVDDHDVGSKDFYLYV